MDQNKLRLIEKSQNALFKKFGVTYALSIVFPQDKMPTLGKVAIWLLNRMGARINMKVVEMHK